MTTAEIIIGIALIVVGGLAYLGYRLNRRRAAENEPAFVEHLETVNRDLAAAHAADKGWEPERLHEAATSAFTEQRAGAVKSLQLVAVIDPPGKDDDKAIFNVDTDNGTFKLTMGRRGDDWVFEKVG